MTTQQCIKVFSTVDSKSEVNLKDYPEEKTVNPNHKKIVQEGFASKAALVRVKESDLLTGVALNKKYIGP